MDDSFIVIDNVEESDLLRALQELSNLYSDTGFTDEIKLFRKKDKYDSFLIQFSNLPDFERFSYFVNFLFYPFDMEKFEPVLKGYYQTKNIKESFEFNTGEWLMLFMTKNHTEYDEVSLVNEKNENFNYDFGGGIKKLDQQLEMFKLIKIDLKSYYHVKDIYPDKSKPDIESKPWWKFW